ncbi:hypothetical protein GCM10027597_04870 [Saccharopolyspora tripterygii]
MSWWLLSTTVVLGLLFSTRVLGKRVNAARLRDLHRFVSALSLTFLAVHAFALLADTWVNIGLPQLLIPFTSSYRPTAVAWGVIAAYLLVAIQATSLLSQRIPHRWWSYVHRSAFAVFGLTTVHAFTAGTDDPVVLGTGIVLIWIVGFFSLYRLLAGRRASADTSAPAEPAEAVEPPGTQPVIVAGIRPVADKIIALELSSVHGVRLPAWEPGAHVDLVLPSGQIGQYSLCGDPANLNTYRIGVLHVPAGGVSDEVHALRAGQRVAISRPRNRFPLVLADHYLFIAGGIGITPLLPMVRAVAEAGREWSLIYGARSGAAMAFTEELLALDRDRVHLVREDTDGLPDLADALAETPPGAAVYACGPEPLLTSVKQIVATRFPDRHLHTERFAAAGAATADFQVELRRSGRILPVPADRSLLDVVRDAVPDAPASCEEGYCGTCELVVLEGIPDHRDTVLRPDERDRRDVVYPCVSRARSPKLTVDL